MKTLVRCVLGCAIGVVLLAITFLVLWFNPMEGASGGIVFASGEARDVQSVAVKNETGEYFFFFDFEEDGFVLDDIPPYLVDLEIFVAFMENCANLFALYAIPYYEVDAEAKGLVPPQAWVGIDFFDGSAIDLQIGAREEISNHYYARVNRSNDVYVISRAMIEPFLMPKTQVVTRMVTPPLALSSPLSAIHDIRFTGEGVKREIEILSVSGAEEEVRLAALSFGAPTHLVQGAATYQLDQSYGVEIFDSLFGITGDIVAYNLSDEEMADFGFENPYMVVEYNMTNGVDVDERQMRLKIAKASDGLFYITHDELCAVFLIEPLPFINIQFEQLPLRWFLNPLLMDLSAVTIRGQDVEYRFEIDASDLRNLIVTYDGQELEVDLFHAFFRLITSAAHDGTYLGVLAPPPGEALLEIIYEYSVEGKAPDTLSLYPGVERRANVYINGAGEFAMRDLFVERVLEGSENLIHGREIEENW